MFHKAVDLKFNEGTPLDVTFQSVAVKRYDTASLFGKYPQLEALRDNPAPDACPKGHKNSKKPLF